MAGLSSPGGHSQPTRYMFIDGESLSKTVQSISEKYFPVTPELNWIALKQDHRKVFYYDAISAQEHGELDRVYDARIALEKEKLDAIQRVPQFHVRTGDLRFRKGRGREQKMVDVQLAVDALSMASRGLFNACTFITSDLDFKPLVSALVEMGIDVNLLYRKGATNLELIAAADTATPFTIDELRVWLKYPFAPAQALPMAGWETGAFYNPGLIELMKFDGGKFGQCTILTPDRRTGFLVYTEKGGEDSNMRLRINGSDPRLIRVYAKEHYGLEVPEWESPPVQTITLGKL